MSKNQKETSEISYPPLFCSNLTCLKKDMSIVDKADLISNSLTFPKSVSLLIKWDNISSLKNWEKERILVYSFNKYLVNQIHIGYLLMNHIIGVCCMLFGSNSNIYSSFIISSKLATVICIQLQVHIDLQRESQLASQLSHSMCISNKPQYKNPIKNEAIPIATGVEPDPSS